MAYYNARRTVESMVLPFAFYAVTKAGVDDDYAATRDEMSKMFYQAAVEVSPTHMTDKEAQQLLYRVSDLVGTCITNKDRKFDVPANEAGLSLFYFLSNMLEQSAYVVSPDSSMQKAMDMFLPAIEPWANNPAVDRAAFREAQEILKRMHQNSYYRDVQWVLEYEEVPINAKS